MAAFTRMNHSSSSISVIGLGAMGSALATALLAQGRQVTVWNRTTARTEPLVKIGAQAAATVADALTASPVVILCVFDYPSVLELLTPAETALAGRTVINLTNGRPSEARAMAQWITERGADYLDGGIMAVPPMIGSPHSLILYSGSARAFEANRGTLEIFGRAQFFGTDPGLASLHDLSLLAGMYGTFAGFFHAAALVGTEGVKAADFLALLNPWLEAVLTFLPGLAQQIDASDYTLDVTSNLQMQVGGLANILQASTEQGISPALLAPLQELFHQRLAAGHGAEDISGVIEYLRR